LSDSKEILCKLWIVKVHTVYCVSRINKLNLISLMFVYCDIFTYMFQPVMLPSSG